MGKRIGFIGIIVEDTEAVRNMNDLLSQYSHLIVGRMGIPRHGAVNVIVVIIEGDNDEIGALTGKLGGLKGLTVRSALSNYVIPE
ncbi:MAG: CopG family transcriptional regulator [Peptococcaceae bacterium]|nr:CopG family transcriptional regulator [Peptococcaceae bacterium]